MTEQTNYKTGDYIKFHIPGEQVWGLIIEVINKDRLTVELKNNPVMPTYKYDDVLTIISSSKHGWEVETI